MRRHQPLILASLVTGALLAPVVFSQAPPPPPPPAATAYNGAQPLYDPQQFPAYHGVVQQFTLTGRGDIDGLVLKDGTEVKTPTTLSTQLAVAIKPGDAVTVRGLRAAALPLVSAVSITNEASHRTVSDTTAGAASPPPGLAGAASGAITEVSGRVRMALHGPRGEVNGVLLDSGTVLRIPPDQADQMAATLQVRQSLVAQGVSLSSPLGTVVEVQALGATREQLRPVGPGPLDGPRARPASLRGTRRGPMPPPPPAPIAAPPQPGAALSPPAASAPGDGPSPHG